MDSMHITMSDMMPVSLCLATQELFDTKRYQQNFGDYCLLRAKDSETESAIWPVKKELGGSAYQKKYLEGHKAVIASNIDKILSIVSARYAGLSVKSVEAIVREGKSLLRKVLSAQTFEDLLLLDPIFKSKVSLPVYELFLEYNKRAAQRMM